MSRTLRSKLEISARVWVGGGALFALTIAIIDPLPMVVGIKPPNMLATRGDSLLWLLLLLAYSASLATVAIRRALNWIRLPIGMLICCSLAYWLWAFWRQLQLVEGILALRFFGLTLGIFGMPMILALLILKTLGRKNEAGTRDHGVSQSVGGRSTSAFVGTLRGRQFLMICVGLFLASLILYALFPLLWSDRGCENSTPEDSAQLAGIDDASTRKAVLCAASQERCQFRLSSNSDGSFTVSLDFVRGSLFKGCIFVAQDHQEMVYSREGRFLHIEEWYE